MLSEWPCNYSSCRGALTPRHNRSALYRACSGLVPMTQFAMPLSLPLFSLSRKFTGRGALCVTAAMRRRSTVHSGGKSVDTTDKMSALRRQPSGAPSLLNLVAALKTTKAVVRPCSQSASHPTHLPKAKSTAPHIVDASACADHSAPLLRPAAASSMPSLSSPRSVRLARSTVTCLLLASTSLIGGAVAGGDGGWKVGRATWYDDAPWMTVHKGSCQYGHLGNRFGGDQNWHVGAMNDGNPEYDGPPGPDQEPAGCCGKCYEVHCEPMKFKDGYGVWLDRTTQCKSTQPITITITDSCPCSKPENPYSNKRWCCADMNHLDLGVWAFRKLADPKVGVVGIKYRRVACPGGQWPTQVQAFDKQGR